MAVPLSSPKSGRSGAPRGTAEAGTKHQTDHSVRSCAVRRLIAPKISNSALLLLDAADPILAREQLTIARAFDFLESRDASRIEDPGGDNEFGGPA